ncbi:MAG TPA: hypothetical protein VFJ02_14435 [Vicinamibacterales bacterium]|nr:hypothetical protein [Vicinamibacterales bacterium]
MADAPHATEIALRVFEEIRNRFPALMMTLNREPEQLDLTLDIPAQQGLLFSVHLNLQNRDELHLSVADGFWLEWFPCTSPAIVDAYKEAVSGLIEGDFRIVEYRSNGKFVCGSLQRPDGAGWQTIGRSQGRFASPWHPTEERVLQNVSTRSSAAPPHTS